MLEFLEITHRYAEQVVEAAGHKPAVHHLGAAADFAFEGDKPIVNLSVKPHRNKNIEGKAKLGFVYLCGVTGDVPLCLELSEATGAGRGGESNFLT